MACAGRWRRWPRPRCRGGPRPGRGGGGPGCLRSAPGPPGSRQLETAQHGEDEGGGQGVGVVLAQDAAAAGQGVFGRSRAAWCSPTQPRMMARLWAEARVSGWSSPRTRRRRRARVSSSSCTWALLGSPAIPALSPRRRVRAKLPPSTSTSECEQLGYGRGRFMIVSGLWPGALGGAGTPGLQIRRCPYWRPDLYRPVRDLGLASSRCPGEFGASRKGVHPRGSQIPLPELRPAVGGRPAG